MEMSNCGGYHGPSVDKRQDRTALTPCDYEQKRIAAMRVMQTRPAGYRVPTNVWAGYGVSHTSPAGILKDNQTVVKKVIKTKGVSQLYACMFRRKKFGTVPAPKTRCLRLRALV